MKQHRGMRPQDIVILLKIAVLKDQVWYGKDLSHTLNISASEISESLNRSCIAGFLGSDKKKLMKGALIEFLEHGLKYVFPVKPGGMERGIPTAHSAFPLNEKINSSDVYVWPSPEGKQRGFAIEPLYLPTIKSVLIDQEMHEILALVDAIRLKGSRDNQIAISIIKERL